MTLVGCDEQHAASKGKPELQLLLMLRCELTPPDVTNPGQMGPPEGTSDGRSQGGLDPEQLQRSDWV
jgi:hypothetical protein